MIGGQIREHLRAACGPHDLDLIYGFECPYSEMNAKIILRKIAAKDLAPLYEVTDSNPDTRV
jgi:hypothetical protein